MTREKCKQMLPVIQAFADGKIIEYWDATEITGTFSRGLWKTAENIGMGAPISYYRMFVDGVYIYFDGGKEN